MLYGTTLTGGNLKHTRPKHACCGTVFTINPSTGAERVLTQFGHNAPLGYQPGGPIALRNGLIYGANQRPYGSVFAVNAATGHAKALYTFSTSSPSAVPLGGVIYHRGTMYGVTEGYEDGSPRATIYQLTP
jgi:hypothetical protein